MTAPGRLLAAVLAAGLTTGATARPFDPFAVLDGCATLTTADRAHLAADGPIVRILPARGHQVGVVAVLRINADAPRLIAWTRRIADLKKNPLVKGIQRLSDPPALDDFSALTFDEDDLDAFRSCLSADCPIKITASEGRALHGDLTGPDWKRRAEAAGRRLLLDRVTRYREGGLAAVPTDDGDPAMSATFADLVRATPCLTSHLPGLAATMLHDATPPAPPVESFFYWSKEQATGKAIVSITQSLIIDGASGALPPGVDAAIAGKQIFSTHYTNGSLTLTLLLRDDEGQHYLAYLNRTDVDLISGMFGGLARRLIERRARSEAERLMTSLRTRIESGDPPR